MGFIVWAWIGTILCALGIVVGIIATNGIMLVLGVIGVLIYGLMASVETVEAFRS
jgi:hypothetical protein